MILLCSSVGITTVEEVPVGVGGPGGGAVVVGWYWRRRSGRLVFL